MRQLFASTIAIAVLALLALPQGARAQSASASCPDGNSCSATVAQTASITIEQVLYIDVGDLGITFPNAAAAAFNAGYANTTDVTNVSSAGNVSHVVQLVEAGNGDGAWAYTGTRTNPGKEATDLEYTTDNGTTWTPLPLSGSPSQLYSVGAGEHPNEVTLDWRVALSYVDDVPGDYSLDVDFTVVAN